MNDGRCRLGDQASFVPQQISSLLVTGPSDARRTRGNNLKSDKSPSQIRNPKLQIGLPQPAVALGSMVRRHCVVQFQISNFGFEMGFCPISQFPSTGFDCDFCREFLAISRIVNEPPLVVSRPVCGMADQHRPTAPRAIGVEFDLMVW
jgi:hypothetical protein